MGSDTALRVDIQNSEKVQGSPLVTRVDKIHVFFQKIQKIQIIQKIHQKIQKIHQKIQKIHQKIQ